MACYEFKWRRAKSEAVVMVVVTGKLLMLNAGRMLAAGQSKESDVDVPLAKGTCCRGRDKLIVINVSRPF